MLLMRRKITHNIYGTEMYVVRHWPLSWTTCAGCRAEFRWETVWRQYAKNYYLNSEKAGCTKCAGKTQEEAVRFFRGLIELRLANRPEMAGFGATKPVAPQNTIKKTSEG